MWWRRRAAGGDLTDRDARWARRVTIVAAVVFLFAVCKWRPWDLFDRAGFSGDFYDAQAHAFLRLRLDVPAAIPGPEGFLIGGKTYLYYGPLLALARLPFAVFGHWADGRLVRLSLVAGYVVLLTATFHLVRQAARSVVARAALPGTVVVTAMAVSPALFLTGWVSVYHETEMWAAALCIAAAAQALRLWREPSRAALLWASGFALATLLTRATVGIGAFVAIAGVGLLVLRRDRRIAIGALAAAAIGALVHVGLNEAKFGTLFDLPADRQLLTLQSPTRAAWFAGNGGSFFSPRFLPTTIVQYLRPDTIRLERLLPVVRYGPLAHVFGSYPLESNTASSSLTASATLLLVMAIVGVVVLIRRRLWGPLVVLGGMIVAAIPSFLIGFTANRYLVDMLPALAVPAAFAAVTWRSPARRWIRVLFVVGVVWGAWVNLALATWTQQLKSPGFTAWRYEIDDALFGGSPQSVVRLGPTVPRDGVVGIDGQCTGLYIAEQGRWVALERSPARRVGGTFTPGADTTLLSGDAGTLTLSAVDDGVQVSWLPADGEPVDGPVLAWSGGPVEVTVVSDPIVDGLLVTVGGKVGLLAGNPPDLSTMQPGPSFTTKASTTPICDDVAARLT